MDRSARPAESPVRFTALASGLDSLARNPVNNMDAKRNMSLRWSFGQDIPTIDFFDGLQLSDPCGVGEAVERFVEDLENNTFRIWEALVRQEQGLPLTPFLSELAGRLINSGEEQDDRVLYLNGLPRPSEPWHDILRQLAPHMLIEPFRTFEPQADGLELWPRLMAALENHGRGLSLPEGARRPLDVLPVDLRHKLWLQAGFDCLSGLGQFEKVHLADEDQHYRLDDLIDMLRAHRDSVEFFDLTLDRLLERVVLPEGDRPVFVQMMCNRLGLAGSNTPLAARLAATQPAPEQVERWPEDQIKQAILHPDPMVRETAVNYFGDSHCSDPSILPVAMQAIDRYGWQQAFQTQYFFLTLAHGDEAVSWMLDQIRQADTASMEDMENPKSVLPYALTSVDPVLLEPHEHEIRKLSALEDQTRGLICSGIGSLRLNPSQLWSKFEQYVADPMEGLYPTFPDLEELRDVVKVLGPEPRLVTWVLDRLAHTVDDVHYSMWLEGVAIQLAGDLRLGSAIEYLVPLLHDDESDVTEDAQESLVRIGTDEVVDALDAVFPNAREEFRQTAASLLQNIPTDKSAAVLMGWLKQTVNDRVRVRLLHAALAGFVTTAIEPARSQLLAAQNPSADLTALKITLVAVCTATGATFAELEPWKAEAQDDFERLHQEAQQADRADRDAWDEEGDFYNDESELDDESDMDDESDLDDESDMDDEETEFGPMNKPWDDSSHEASAPTIFNTKTRVGRNEPCPCGSGKKYKKCCLRKDR